MSSRTLWHNPVVPRVGKFCVQCVARVPRACVCHHLRARGGPVRLPACPPSACIRSACSASSLPSRSRLWTRRPLRLCARWAATFWQSLFYARLPQLMPIFSLFSLNHFEIAVRSASTLGLVGAGDIGAPLIFAIQARNWATVSIILIWAWWWPCSRSTFWAEPSASGCAREPLILGPGGAPRSRLQLLGTSRASRASTRRLPAEESAAQGADDLWVVWFYPRLARASAQKLQLRPALVDTSAFS